MEHPPPRPRMDLQYQEALGNRRLSFLTGLWPGAENKDRSHLPARANQNRPRDKQNNGERKENKGNEKSQKVLRPKVEAIKPIGWSTRPMARHRPGSWHIKEAEPQVARAFSSRRDRSAKGTTNRSRWRFEVDPPQPLEIHNNIDTTCEIP